MDNHPEVKKWLKKGLKYPFQNMKCYDRIITENCGGDSVGVDDNG